MLTEYFGIPYDEEIMDDKQIQGLEEFCFNLYKQFESKVEELNLCFVDGINTSISDRKYMESLVKKVNEYNKSIK